jgi:outer membrane protein OmpA-like peptidoglycan-associated protein
VRVDERTGSNLELLAKTLVDESLQGRRFVFVGHSDTRGEAEHNMGLSQRRADAAYEAVVRTEPALEGRIARRGRGETEPIELGDSEDAHWANRRLQVLVE